jgi:hypothetical protein
MGTQNNDKTEQTMKMTKQGVRDLNHLTRTVPPVTAEVGSPPAEDAPVAGERVSAPVEP